MTTSVQNGLRIFYNGKRSPAPLVRTQFESYLFPPEGNYELHISGQQEVNPGKSPCNYGVLKKAAN